MLELVGAVAKERLHRAPRRQIERRHEPSVVAGYLGVAPKFLFQGEADERIQILRDPGANIENAVFMGICARPAKSQDQQYADFLHGKAHLTLELADERGDALGGDLNLLVTGGVT